MPDGRLVAVTPEARSDRWWWTYRDLFSRDTGSGGVDYVLGDHPGRLRDGYSKKTL
jgi:hypothetical protein